MIMTRSNRGKITKPRSVYYHDKRLYFVQTRAMTYFWGPTQSEWAHSYANRNRHYVITQGWVRWKK